MPRRGDLKRIMVIGSGPIVIGQACEFDYSGTQAVKALKEEGYEVILVNSNPATIMTDPDMADRTYIEPIEPETVAAIIRKERPDAILPTLGGQTGLNTALELAKSGVLAECGVELIGARADVIEKAESRELFREAMERIGLKVPRSEIARNMDDVRRVVFMVETKMEKDISAQETVKSLFASRPKDFITAVDEKSIIIVKELKDTDTFEDMNQTARMLVDMLNAEAMSQVRVSYGNPVNEIKSVSRSYKEAKMALEVGKIFYADKNVVPYNNLGIGRLIYQLPIPLCEMFMTEVFGENLPDTFDEETLTTINKFFENNLNVSETSRQLYVHRNTLVYRLEKLEKSTGLDIRKFDDALTFKIAMMVVSYMTYMNNSENL